MGDVGRGGRHAIKTASKRQRIGHLTADATSVGRDRSAPIDVAAVDVCGGRIGFSLSSPQLLEFSTSVEMPILVGGVRLCPHGTLRVSITDSKVSISAVEFGSLGIISRDAAWLDEREHFSEFVKLFRQTVERTMRQAVESMCLEATGSLEACVIEKVDDAILEAMADLQTWTGKLDETPAASMRDQDVWRELLLKSQRRLAELDQIATTHAGLPSSMSGYVLLREGRLLMRPVQWGPAPKSALDRVFFRTFAEADRTRHQAGDLDATIQRVRFVDGSLHVAQHDRLQPAPWKLSDAVYGVMPEPD